MNPEPGEHFIIRAAQPIKPYRSPRYLVEPTGPPVDEDELHALNNDPGVYVEVLDNRVMGWEHYNAILGISSSTTSYCALAHIAAGYDEGESAGVWPVGCDGQCGALLFVDSPNEPPQEKTYFCSPACRQWYEGETDAALLVAQMEVPAVGGLGSDEASY